MFNTKLNLLIISFLQLISFSGFLLCCLSYPIVRSWGLARVGGIYYGAFGYCQDADVFFCSPIHLLYNVSKVGLSDSSFEKWWLNAKTRDKMGELLISIPIATCFTLICSILPFVSFFLYPPKGIYVPLIILNATLHTLSFLSTAFTCIVILLQFHPYTTWCGWLTLPCSFCSLLACILVFGCIHQHNRTEIIEKEASIENLDSILKLYGTSQTSSALDDKSSQATKSTVLSPSSKSVHLSTSISNNLQRTLDPNQNEPLPEILPSVKNEAPVNFFIPNLHDAPMFCGRKKVNKKTISFHELDMASLLVKQEDLEMPIEKKMENILYYEDITSPSQCYHDPPWLFGANASQSANFFKVYSRNNHYPTAPPQYQLRQTTNYVNQDKLRQNSLVPRNPQRKLVGHNRNDDHKSHTVPRLNENSRQKLPEAYNAQNMLPRKYRPAYKQRIYYAKGDPQPAYTFH